MRCNQIRPFLDPREQLLSLEIVTPKKPPSCSLRYHVRMPKKPQPPPPTTWTIYKVAAKQTRLGEVEAADEREAIERAAKEFGQHASKLIAVRRS